MADDDDTIWVEVRARADEASFNEVEETLRDKLKGATEGDRRRIQGSGRQA